MTTRRWFMASAALIAATILLISTPSVARAGQEKVQLRFVQTAEYLKADDKILRLVNVGQQTLSFSDRPVRLAGHVTMDAYIEEWQAEKHPCRGRDQSPGR